jgi:hypothetical protein
MQGCKNSGKFKKTYLENFKYWEILDIWGILRILGNFEKMGEFLKLWHIQKNVGNIG